MKEKHKGGSGTRRTTSPNSLKKPKAPLKIKKKNFQGGGSTPVCFNRKKKTGGEKFGAKRGFTLSVRKNWATVID